jgi:hypothetical protein
MANGTIERMHVHRSSEREFIDRFVGAGVGWEHIAEHNTIELNARTAWLFITFRPPYCDRGAILVHVERRRDVPPGAYSIDEADAFPRYYFTADAAWAEVSAWLTARNEWP